MSRDQLIPPEAIKTRRNTFNRCQFVVNFFIFGVILLVVLLCPSTVDVFKFFLPLLLSTGICFSVAYHFIFPEYYCRRKTSLPTEKAQSYSEVTIENFSELQDAQGNSCGTSTEDFKENQAEKVVLGKDDVDILEEMSSQVDILAEVIWNSYFGSYSSWDNRLLQSEFNSDQNSSFGK